MVPAGRLFLCHLITLASTVVHLHHQIRLNAEARADITWWRTLLPTWNGTAKFIDPNSVLAVDMLLYTDASGSYGSGAYCQGGWFFHVWRPMERAVCHCGSSFDMGTWQGKQVKFMCDNQAIVLAWQGQCSSDSHIMNLMCTLCRTAPVHHPRGQHF